jgi:hypothetical protein
MSVFGELFSLFFSQMLQQWADANDQLTQCQFGFKAGKSTVDCVFILHSIIAKLLSKGEEEYCAFVDFENAFDKVNRHLLWYKLLSLGVSILLDLLPISHPDFVMAISMYCKCFMLINLNLCVDVQ